MRVAAVIDAPAARSRITVRLDRAEPTGCEAEGVRLLDLRRHPAGSAGPVSAEDLHAAAERLRGDFLAYVSARGLEEPGREWWTGWIAERNPFVSEAFYFSCLVAAAVDAIERDPGPWRVVVDEPSVALAVRDTLRARGHAVEISPASVSAPWRTRAEFVARRGFFVWKWLSRIFIARIHWAARQPALRAVVKSGRPLAIAHEWIDQRRFDNRTGRLGPAGLAPAAAGRIEAAGECVVSLPVILRSVPFRRAVRAVLVRPEPTLLPEAFISPLDVLEVFVRSFARRRTRQYPPLAGLHVHALFDRDAHRDWIHHRRLDNELLGAMVTRWRRAGLRVARLIHPFEHHTWETVMGLALSREYPHARRIGVLQPALSRFRLNEFVTADEWVRAPMPDRVVTYGPLATRCLGQAGAPAGRLVTGTSSWFTQLSTRPPVSAVSATVLVGFSIHATESRELLDCVRQALGNISSVEVWLKFHPTLPASRVLRGGERLPPHFSVVDRPIHELVGEASVMVYGSSGICLEALAAGATPVHVRTRTCLDQDPLEFWPDLREIATDAASLAHVIRTSAAQPVEERERRQRAGLRALHEYFGPETPDSYEAFAR